jgi:predicted RND superfamily exporter protein
LSERIERINAWFSERARNIIRWRWVLIALMVILNAAAFAGLKYIRIDVSNDNIFLRDDPLTIAKHRFESIFGNNEYVTILVEAEDVFAPEMLKMIRALGRTLKAEVPYADKLISLTDFDFTKGTETGLFIGNIVPREIPTDPGEIEKIKSLAFSKQLLVNRMFSDDCKQAWITLRLRNFPDSEKADLKNNPQMMVARSVYDILNRDDYKGYQLKAAGIPIANYDKQMWYGKELRRIMGILLLAIVIISALLLRSVTGVAVSLFCSFSSILWVFGAMGWLAARIDGSAMSVPIFIGFSVTVGYSIHLFNSFKRTFLISGHRCNAVIAAMRKSAWPIFFTAMTTVSALFSFYFVEIKTVRWIGLAAGCEVLAGFIIIILLMPAVLSFGKNREPDTQYVARHGGRIGALLERIGVWVQTHPARMVTIFVLMILSVLPGLALIHVDINMKNTHGLKMPWTARLDYIGHTKIGSMYAYDIMIQMAEENSAKKPATLKNLDLLAREISDYPYIKRTTCLADSIKELNQALNGNVSAFHAIPDDERLIAQQLLLYRMAGGRDMAHWVDNKYQTLRINAEVMEFSTAKIGKTLDHVTDRAKSLFPGATIGMVGSIIQFGQLNTYLINGQIISLSIALVVIMIFMMVAFSSVKTGLIGMIPNIMPVLFIGGLIGYMGKPLDFITMLIGPMIIGIAVDDTIHFMNFCKFEFFRTGSYGKAINATFRVVGESLFMTTVVIVFGFAAYMSSISKMYFHLGLHIIVAVCIALIADFFLVPILILWTKPYGPEKTLLPNQIRKVRNNSDIFNSIF